LDPENAKKIVCNAVETTRPIWESYDEHWSEIDRIFLIRAYEQGGFETWKFAKLLYFNSIFSIEKIGSILDGYTGRKYVREFAGSIDSPFYKDMKIGKYGIEGEKFYNCAKNFKGKFGSGYWMHLWRMLICCHELKEKYHSSFSFYLKTKYAEFKGLKYIPDEDFRNISIDDWEEFKKVKPPWKDLYGVGINVFDFIIGDVGELKFLRNSFKLDLSNEHFIEITGIYDGPHEHDSVKNFFKNLNLPYSLREINTGIFLYCSETAEKDFGFCREKLKCVECTVNGICERNFDKKNPS
jgi:hypothetical protein